MNGRIYDPTLGRFLQADPFIQFRNASQSYNRYSYVLNNPMSYTDPSGYFLKKLYKATMKLDGRWAAHKFTAKNPMLHSIGVTALNFIPLFFGQLAAAHANFDHALVQTGSLRAAFRSGVVTYATSYALSEIGASDYWGEAGSIQNIAANAMVGGISAELQGGNFGHGF